MYVDLPIVPRVVLRFDTLPEGYRFTGPEATHREDRLGFCAACGLDLRVVRRFVVQATLDERLRLNMLRAAYYTVDHHTDFRERAQYVAPLQDALECYSQEELRAMHDAFVQGMEDAQYVWCGIYGVPEFVGVGGEGALLFEVSRVTV